jgi:AraC family transcriptional regulator
MRKHLKGLEAMLMNSMHTDTDPAPPEPFDDRPPRQPRADSSPGQDRLSHFSISDGIAAEIVQATSYERFAFRFRAPVHMLVVYEQGARYDGETFVEGSPRSRLRDFTRKLTLVPANHEYREWQEPWTLTRLMYVYFDPAELHFLCDSDITGVTMSPKLFFEDARLFDTALKLKRSLESPAWEPRIYLEALGIMLAHELISFHRRTNHSSGGHRRAGGSRP